MSRKIGEYVPMEMVGTPDILVQFEVFIKFGEEEDEQGNVDWLVYLYVPEDAITDGVLTPQILRDIATQFNVLAEKYSH